MSDPAATPDDEPRAASVSLPAGSYDLADLDAALKPTHKIKDAAERQAAVDEAVAKQNTTEFDNSGRRLVDPNEPAQGVVAEQGSSSRASSQTPAAHSSPSRGSGGASGDNSSSGKEG